MQGVEDDVFCCPVCLEQYNREEFVPKIMPCGHRVCQICITKIQGKCPRDRLTFTLHSPLPVDRDLLSLIEARNSSVSLVRMPEMKTDDASQEIEPGAAGRKCDVHSEKEAFVRCVRCDFDVCEQCSVIHKKKGHSMRRFSQVLKCKVHNEEFRLYCEKCNMLICLMCYALKHHNHTVKNTIEVVSKAAEKLSSDIVTLEKALESLLLWKEDLSKGIPIAQSQADNYNVKIQSYFDEVVKFVELSRAKALQESAQKHSSRLEEMKNDLEQVSKLLAEGRQQIESKKKLLEDPENLKLINSSTSLSALSSSANDIQKKKTDLGYDLLWIKVSKELQTWCL
jgi:predicted  nucleic acid-binding Zn-ribbon protein